MSYWVRYKMPNSAAAAKFRAELRKAGAPFIASAEGMTYALVGDRHNGVPHNSASRYGGRFTPHVLPPQYTVKTPCGMEWDGQAEQAVRMHRNICKSCKRLAENGSQASKNALETDGAVVTPISAGSNGSTEPSGSEVAESDPIAELRERLRAVGDDALKLAEKIDDAIRALGTLSDYEARLAELQREYDTAMTRIVTDLLPGKETSGERSEG